ncbi:MAG: hypothetical protein AB1560_03690 [Pseudomonadota bacterium]
MGILHGRQARYFGLVKSESWRRRFLGQLSDLAGFDTFLKRSRVAEKGELSRLLASMRGHAKRLIKTYPKHELAAARQYYNNEQLVHFWRGFSQELEGLIRLGAVPREFPVFEVSIDGTKQLYGARAVSIRHFEEIEVHRVSDHPLRYRWNPKTGDVRQERDGDDAQTAATNLESLMGKLTILHDMVFRSLRSLYGIFVEYNRMAGTKIWDYYRIHQFLDNFLYVAPNGEPCRSSFDFVFFNSNVHELRLYLAHHHDKQLPLTLSDVSDFLKRQRTYYQKLAVSISLEESEALNHRKDLYEYDEKCGVVMLAGITDEFKRHLHKHKIEPIGLLRLDGCPFAKSRGVERNALIEVYEFFDRLVLHFLAHSREFDRLFGRQRRTST